MKRFIVTGLACFVALACLGQSLKPTSMTVEADLKKKIALACKLTDREQIQRMNELHQTIFKKVTRAVAHPDRYELVFEKSDASMVGELAEFIKFERLCCPWLLFQLTFQPEEGPISLSMGNSAETKEMVYLVMELAKLEKSATR